MKVYDDVPPEWLVYYMYKTNDYLYRVPSNMTSFDVPEVTKVCSMQSWTCLVFFPLVVLYIHALSGAGRFIDAGATASMLQSDRVIGIRFSATCCCTCTTRWIPLMESTENMYILVSEKDSIVYWKLHFPAIFTTFLSLESRHSLSLPLHLCVPIVQDTKRPPARLQIRYDTLPWWWALHRRYTVDVAIGSDQIQFGPQRRPQQHTYALLPLLMV